MINIKFYKSGGKYVGKVMNSGFRIIKASEENYQKVGEKILNLLKSLYNERIFEEIKISPFENEISWETPQEEELILVKNSLDELIQKNKLNAKVNIGK
jgi:hypothetical protein